MGEGPTTVPWSGAGCAQSPAGHSRMLQEKKEGGTEHQRAPHPSTAGGTDTHIGAYDAQYSYDPGSLCAHVTFICIYMNCLC